jgi:hypothetical protein
LEDLPDWLPGWCVDHLGGEPAEVLFQSRQVSMVFGLRLPGGTDVVVKARADDGRAVSCVAAQARLAERGFPCARPLTPVVGVGSLAVHAEELRPGGEVLYGDSPDMAERYAEVFARLTGELADVTVPPPLPNPPWVRWDHTDSGVWPAIGCPGNRDQTAVPAYVVDTAVRARGRLLAARLPCVLGHADFEAQNLRWHGWEVWAVHDWDSLAWQPEAALAGAASGAFASAGPPTLAPIESSEAFLVAYQDSRGACSRPLNRRSRGRPACGWRRTTYGRHCTATPRCPAMRFAHKQPNDCAGLMPSTSERLPPSVRWPKRTEGTLAMGNERAAPETRGVTAELLAALDLGPEIEGVTSGGVVYEDGAA